MTATQCTRPKAFERCDIRCCEVNEKRIDGFKRPLTTIRVFDIKTDKWGDDPLESGVIIFPCTCLGLSDHDPQNNSCMANLMRSHQSTFKKLETGMPVMNPILVSC